MDVPAWTLCTPLVAVVPNDPVLCEIVQVFFELLVPPGSVK